MKQALAMILLFLVVSTASVTAQQDNPDRYTSITIGTGFHGTYQTFLTDNYPGYKWDRMVDAPMFYTSIIIPATDYLSVIFSGYYQPDYSSRWDDHGISPENFIHKEYSYTAALKFYIR